MANYTFATKLMEHSGGTKFYETVQITNDASPPESVLIRRWGPIEKMKRRSAGQHMLFKGNPAVVHQENAKILLAKSKSGYVPGLVNFGLHKREHDTLTDQELLTAVADFYDAEIVTYVSTTFDLPRAIGRTPKPAAKAVAAPPEPEPDRGELWGAF